MKAEQERRIALERQQQERKAAIEKQIQELAKQSLIGGFVNLGLQTTSIALKKDERVVWETPGCKLKQRTSNGVPFWESDGVGTLVVTDQRVIFARIPARCGPSHLRSFFRPITSISGTKVFAWFGLMGSKSPWRSPECEPRERFPSGTRLFRSR